MAPTLTPEEVEYLRSQPLGRLATVDASGAPQNNPVGVWVDDATGDLLIGGFRMGKTRKWRNVLGNPHVALVVDNLISRDPWTVRGVEVRGLAVAVEDGDPPMQGLSRQVIRITPSWIGSWGVIPDEPGMSIRR